MGERKRDRGVGGAVAAKAKTKDTRHKTAQATGRATGQAHVTSASQAHQRGILHCPRALNLTPSPSPSPQLNHSAPVHTQTCTVQRSTRTVLVLQLRPFTRRPVHFWRDSFHDVITCPCCTSAVLYYYCTRP